MTAIERAAIAAAAAQYRPDAMVYINAATKPDKEQVRAVMQQHRDTRTLPTPEQIRAQLGWFLLTTNSTKAPECAR